MGVDIYTCDTCGTDGINERYFIYTESHGYQCKQCLKLYFTKDEERKYEWIPKPTFYKKKLKFIDEQIERLEVERNSIKKKIKT